MQHNRVIVFFLMVLAFSSVAQRVPATDVQIKLALMAAPDESRNDAQVYGYDKAGDFKILRAGKNNLICLADDPNQKGFNVSCYHKDLEPFMARGRDLKTEGKNFEQVFAIREKEARSGKLKMPVNPSTLYVLSTEDDKYNPVSGEVKDTYLRYVVYIPYATAESTGLPLKPTLPGMPWIMDPGTHRAHIMISPPQEKRQP